MAMAGHSSSDFFDSHSISPAFTFVLGPPCTNTKGVIKSHSSRCCTNNLFCCANSQVFVSADKSFSLTETSCDFVSSPVSICFRMVAHFSLSRVDLSSFFNVGSFLMSSTGTTLASASTSNSIPLMTTFSVVAFVGAVPPVPLILMCQFQRALAAVRPRGFSIVLGFFR